MIVSFKHRFIYIKNRKVGGTSLERYLIEKLLSLKEFSNYQDKTSFRPKNDSYKKYYDIETKSLVEKILEDEINQFEYKF